MKKIISTFLVISNLLFANQLSDQYWESNSNFSSFIDKINTNHYFSMLSSSSDGSLNTYGMYGNWTHFTLNNRTQLYSNFNIMKSMQSEHTYMNDMSYSISLGMKYQLSDNTSLSLGVTIMESFIANTSNYNYMPYNNYPSYLP
tara:strand:+ start:2226 stop:2657 length:432 start_codon:yes stop_codon:yes gene_type:complete